MNTRVCFYVSAAIVLLCCSARAKAQNDLCTQAIPINCFSSTNGTTVGATLDGGLPTCFGPSPANSGGSLVVTAPGVWYLVQGTGQTVTADTLVASYDTKISVYTGVSCAALNCVTADDDIQGTPFHSKVAFQTQPGALYFIMVHGFGTQTGTFTLNVRCDPTPPNDNCATAQPIGDGSFSGTTLGATGERFDPNSNILASCAINGNHPVFDVWYDYLASCSGNLTVNTCGPFDTLLSVHSVCPTAAAGNQLTPVASTCNDNGPAGCTPGSQLLTVPVTSGTHYRIRVAGGIGANSGGSFLLTTACTPAPPPNDPCSGAIAISGNGSINGTTNIATNDGVSSCGPPGLPDVWYVYTTPATCGPYDLSFNTCGALDTVLTTYTGACGALVESACNDNCGGAPCLGPGSCISLGLVPVSTTIRIRVASLGTGNFTLNFSGVSLGSPPNDLCSAATPVIEGTHPFNTTCANTDGVAFPTNTSCDPSDGPTNCNNDVWLLYTATCTAATEVTTCNAGTLTDTVLVVYPASAGCPPSDASKLACDDDIDPPFTCATSTLRSAVTFNAVAGTQYLIRVGAFSAGTTGTGAVTITQPPGCSGVTIPPGDDCFHTTCGDTLYEFKNTPIPCSFFDPGSEPFDGTVLLGGDPLNLNLIDTRVRRLNAVSLPQNPPGTAQVPIELVSLSLVSCQPITVRYCNSPNIETWNVTVNLSATPAPPGQMIITKTHPNGGHFMSQFFVRPVFTFARIQGGPPATRTLGVNPILPPIQLGSTDPAPWVHNSTVDPPLNPSCALPGANFFPGVQEAGQSTPGSTCVPTTQCPKPVGHAGPGHLHVTGYVNEPCPCGPCCDPATGTCVEVSGANPATLCAAMFGGTGVFKGLGKSCNSAADADTIPDSYEDNVPCAGGNCATNAGCVAHTDRSRTDSDGDGVPDHADPAPWNRCIPNPSPLCFQFDHVAPLGDGDCDGDGRCDLCAILMGFSHDCNRNGVPDTCEPDCNGNGVPDDYDITCGTSVDANGNGKPDECERVCPIGDMNLDGNVNGLDISRITSALIAGPAGALFCAVDANGSGAFDPGDLAIITSALMTWPDPVVAGGTYWRVAGVPCNDGNRTVIAPCLPGGNLCSEIAIRNEGAATDCPAFAQLRDCNGVDQGAPQAIAPGATISIVRCIGNRELVVWCGVTGAQCKISVKHIGFPACPLNQQPCP